MRKRSRGAIALIMVLALLASAGARYAAQDTRTSAIWGASNVQSESRSSLSSMNSYALTLMLGGLRGPLVMILWPHSENQKTMKDLEGLDTQIEWIRLLQSEFDSVHMFQVWNKAYNISVQMASLSNKYTTILDALDYAHSVDREKPNDINILSTIGQVYFDKLGNSSEKAYYRRRVREESQARREMVAVTLPASRVEEFRQALRDTGNSDVTWSPGKGGSNGDSIAVDLPKTVADSIRPRFQDGQVRFEVRVISRQQRGDSGWHRLQMDPLLDDEGHLLGKYLAPDPALARPANLAADSEWNTGAELQYLEPYSQDNLFHYGVSPFALAYNYYKRAEVLQSVGNQRHLQLSSLVVDSRPPLCLKEWATEERDRAHAAEMRAVGMPVIADADLIKPTAGLTLDKPILDSSARDEAVYEYALTARLCRDGVAEYERHLKAYEFNFDIYQSHMEELRGTEKLALGDHDFLAATAVTGSARQALLDSAAKHYQDALAHYQIYLLRYMVDEPIFSQVVPKGCTKTKLAQIPREQLPAIMAQVALLKAKLFAHGYDPHAEDAQEFERYVARASQRLVTLGR